MNRTLHTAALAALLSLAAPASAQTLPDEVVRDIESLLSREARKETIFDGIRIDSVAVGTRQISLFASQDCSYIPFREENVASLYREIRSLLPSRYDKYRLEVIAEGQPIEELVPLALRSRVNRRIRTFETSCRTPLVTRGEYEEVIRQALDVKRNAALSQAAMEVLAIIAYNQPVTRAFIEQVRGMDSSSVVTSLVNKGLVAEAGRLEIPGRPIAYETTPDFLRCFGMKDIKALPKIPQQEEP